jgi:hypothetical protein
MEDFPKNVEVLENLPAKTEFFHANTVPKAFLTHELRGDDFSPARARVKPDFTSRGRRVKL